jgi:dolichol-phosphate mannosyltransferase
MRSLVIVPTYNEIANLAALAERIIDHGFQLLIVDDNSSDGTGELADQLRSCYPGAVQVLHRASKLGLGSAYVDGFHRALHQQYDYIFQMDADFSHNPDDLPRLQRGLENGADLVVGSRYCAGGATRGWPLFRRLLSRAGSRYAQVILGLEHHDLTAGFKGWRRETLAALNLCSIRSNGYSFQIETTYRAHRLGAAIVEIPITFEERRHGCTKLSRGIIFEAIWIVWKLKLQSSSEIPTNANQHYPSLNNIEPD